MPLPHRVGIILSHKHALFSVVSYCTATFLLVPVFYTACTLPARSINIERKGDQPGSSSEKQPKWHTKISHQNPKTKLRAMGNDHC